MNRAFTLLYGVMCYIVFLATFLYAIGFVGNFGVPKSMDSAPSDSWPSALAIDLALLTVFALQHSIMARPAFKQMLTRVIPNAIERSTYVLASSLALLLLFWQWRPLGGVVWDVHNETGKMLLNAGFAFGWLLVLTSTFVINHFDLFGLRQVWLAFTGQPMEPLAFRTPLFYRIVRHPLYVGWFFAFWSTPQMTVTHLMFAMVTTAYILIAIRLEERDLMMAHPEYVQYRKQVPMILPGLPKHVDIRIERINHGRDILGH